MNTVQRLSVVSGCVGLLLAAVCWPSGGEESMTMDAKRIVRKVAGGGRWFPENRRELEAMVTNDIQAAKVPRIEGRIVGVIAPHAGYVYSGKVAGFAFRAIQDHAAGTNKPETVVVLGFTHSTGFQGVALMDGDVCQTLLGENPLDKEAAAVLQGLFKGRKIIPIDAAAIIVGLGTCHCLSQQIPR